MSQPSRGIAESLTGVGTAFDPNGASRPTLWLSIPPRTSERTGESMTITALASGEPEDGDDGDDGQETWTDTMPDTPGSLSAEAEARAIEDAIEHVVGQIAALTSYCDRLRSQLRNWEKGAASERRLRSMLSRLDPGVWHVFADLPWPGTRQANIDLLVVGPPGVLVLDVKSWSESSVTDERLEEAARNVSAQAAAVRERLTDRGLAPNAVIPFLVFDRPARRLPRTVSGVDVLDARSLLERMAGMGPRLTRSRVDVLTAMVEEALPTCSEHAFAQPGSGAPNQLELINEGALRRKLSAVAEAGPIEDWMVWLDPTQAPLVLRNFTGPARIRGASGTGKTVVALHRAHYLAEQLGHRVLFTTYVGSLVNVESELFQRLGHPRLGSVEFRSVYRWALRLLNRRGINVEVDDRLARQSFDLAWREVGQTLSIASLGVPVEYWREEIQSVIKGRGLLKRDDYMPLERVGRSVPLQPTHRREVWRLFESYERHLRVTGRVDWPDVMALANDELDREPLDRPYDSVVVDEVQDLSVSALRLLTKVVNPKEPRILLVGDGQQSIYTGSFRLSEAGLDVTGRGTVLKVNYRNGRGILDRAMEIVQNLAYSDLDGELASARRKVRAIRPGGAVVEVAENSARALEARLVSDLRALTAGGFRAGDCAILCHSNHDASRWRSVLAQNNIPNLGLEGYRGRTGSAIKVGTYHRAKGLEFAAVFIPDLHTVMKPPRPSESEAAAEERATNEARQLFVACTRARDYLWLGRLNRPM